MENRHSLPARYIIIVFGAIVLSGLYLSSLYSYLFFHFIAETFSIVVAFGIFMVAWNSRRFIDNNYLMFIGIAYLFVGVLDLFHALAYTGMGVFQGYDTNLPTQLWIAARYLQSLSLLAAPFYLRRKLRIYPVLLGYALIAAILLGTIFFGNVFPDCFIEGTGLTPFKKASEYIISMILLGSIALLLKNREEFSETVLRLLAASIIVTIGSEVAFTFYVSAYGFSNLVGHLLKIAAFYLVYKAIIVTGLVSPYDLLFRDLKRNEEALLKLSHDLGERVKELDCLYEISRLVDKDLPLEVIYQEITELLPLALQYPEITCARITLEGQEFKTDGFRQTDRGQASEIIVKGERIGMVEVFHLEEMPEMDEGPFLEEERSLITAIAERLGEFIERGRTEDDLLWKAEVDAKMAEFSRSLIQSISVEEIACFVLEYSKRLTQSRYGYVSYRDAETGFMIVPTLTRDIWDECKVQDKSIVFKELMGLWGGVVENKKPLYTNRAAEDPRSVGTPEGHIPIERFLSAPAMVGDKVVGQIALANSERDYTDRDLELAERIAMAYAFALERRRAEDELQRYRENLEELVEARTSEIKWVNKELQKEIGERGRVEEAVRKSEAGLAEAQRIAHLGSWDWDIETNELFWSDEIYRIFGLSPEEFGATYEAFLSAVHPDDRELVEKSVEDALNKKVPYSIDHRIVLPDGEVRIVHEQAEVTFDEAGQPIRMVGTVQDITQRGRVEEAAKEAKHELEEQRAKAIRADRLRSLGEMAAGIAHELNQPLLGVRGLAEHMAIALERGWKLPKEDILEKVKLIIDQADRMSHVIEHTRIFGRQEDRSELTPVNINDVIESSLVIIGPQLKSGGLVLDSELAQGLPRVLANPFSLEEALLNLVSNARDAMTAKGQADGAPGRISLRTYLDGEGDKKYVKIEVIDAGAGIPEEIMEKVFDPFFTTKDPEKGTGLGLAISKSLIEGVGGHIDLKSRPGQGATAVISLPAVAKVSEEEK